MSDVSICNQALSRIGTRSTITSLTDGSNEAAQCNLVYADTRDQVLSMAQWNFATKVASLGDPIKSAPGTPSNPTGNEAWSDAYPMPPWLYEYAYPTDCLQMRFVVPQIETGSIGVPIFSSMTGPSSFSLVPWNAVRFQVSNDVVAPAAGNVILTNQYQAIGVYTRQVTDTTMFSGNFVEALACAIAAKIAQALTGDRALRGEMFNLANAQIMSARASDGNEGLTILDQQALWIEARDSFTPPSSGWVSPYPPLFS